MATAAWPNNSLYEMSLSNEQTKIFERLHFSAMEEERTINEQCIDLLKGAGITDIPKTHGGAIKLFFKHFYQPSVPYDSEKIFNSYIKKYGEELVKAMDLNEDELVEFGIEALMEELQKNIKDKKYTFAKGNYGELHLFEGLYNGLKQAYGDSAVIVDTSPKYYENSIRYDINVLLSLPGKDDLNVNIESKKGIAELPVRSKFDLGTFSDTGFSMKSNKNTYSSLIDSLQKDFYKFISSTTPTTQETDKWVQNQLIDWSIQYINWRLDNNFPIFMSDVGGGNINLTSEIAQGFPITPGGHVEYTLGDMFTFVNLEKTYNYGGGLNIARYTANKNDLTKTVLEEYIKDTGWKPRSEYTSKFFKGTKITPLFKATVWYGQ